MLQPEFEEDLDASKKAVVLGSAKVQRWLAGLNEKFDLERVVINKVFFFGDKVGYVVGRAFGTNRIDGKPINGIAFIRGDAVAILPVLHAPDGKVWTVLTTQPRPAAGTDAYSELPAGMLDEGEVSSKALEELEEEVGPEFHVTAEDLIPLGQVHPSPGGCDEAITLYAFERHVSQELLTQLQGRSGGLVTENESIRLQVIELDDIPRCAPTDMKARMAHFSWAARQGYVPVLDREAPAPEEPASSLRM